MPLSVMTDMFDNYCPTRRRNSLSFHPTGLIIPDPSLFCLLLLRFSPHYLQGHISEQTTTMTVQLEAFQACFALNNMGVTMLEKGHFQASRRMLKDAASTLKVLARAREITTAEWARLSPAIAAKVHKAEAHVAKTSAIALPVGMEVSPFELGDIHALHAAQQYGSTASLVFPVLLRDSPTQESVACGGMNTHVATMVYNYAISQLLSIRFPERTCQSQQADGTALPKIARLLSVAENYLFQSVCQDGPDFSLSLIYLRSLILANLSWVLRLQNLVDKSNEVDVALRELQNTEGGMASQLFDHVVSRFCAAACA
jgi:hypothetical protein